MGDFTRRAVNAIVGSEPEKVMSPEECLEYLKNPVHFQSFAAYTERLAKEKGIDCGGLSLPSFLKKSMVALDPSIKDAEKRAINRFIDNAWEKDENDCFKTSFKIRRDFAIKMCFCLGLDEKEANDFLRKACSMYGLNIRSAYEATCLYCIITNQPYEKVNDVLNKYNNAPVPETYESKKDTQMLRDELYSMDMDSEAGFVDGFLIPNKAEFIQYSKTAIRHYNDLRTHICDLLLKNTLYLYENELFGNDRNDTNRQSDSAVTYLQGKLECIADAVKDPAFTELLETFKTHTTDYETQDINEEDNQNNSLRYNAFQNMRNLIDDYDTVSDEILQSVSDKSLSFSSEVTGNELFDSLLNAAFSDDTLFKELMYGIPYQWVQYEQTKYGNSSLSDLNSTFMRNFPRAANFSSFFRDTHNPADENMEQKRKLLVFLHFSYRFLSFFHNAWENEPLRTREYRFNNFLSSLNTMLESCNMVCAYPGDPFDWLILMSAVSFLEIGEKGETSPIEFFNRVIWMSFDEDGSVSMYDSDGNYHPEHKGISMV